MLLADFRVLTETTLEGPFPLTGFSSFELLNAAADTVDFEFQLFSGPEEDAAVSDAAKLF